MNTQAPVLALLLLLSLAPAAPAQETAAPPAHQLQDVRTVAVFPFTSGGNVDTFLTSVFLRELRERGVRHALIDPYQLTIHVQDGKPFHAEGQLDALLADARAAGADAIVVGVGVWYSVGFRLETRIIEVNRGTVLWHSAAASGVSLTGPRAKAKVVRRTLRTYPGRRGRA